MVGKYSLLDILCSSCEMFFTFVMYFFVYFFIFYYFFPYLLFLSSLEKQIVTHHGKQHPNSPNNNQQGMESRERIGCECAPKLL